MATPSLPDGPAPSQTSADGRDFNKVPESAVGKENAFVFMTSWLPARKWDGQKNLWLNLPAQQPAVKSFDVTGKETTYDLGEHKGLQIEDASLAAPSGVLAVAWAPADRYAKVLEFDLLDLVRGGRKAVKIERAANYEEATPLLLSPDGATLAIVRPEGASISLHEAATGRERARFDVREMTRRSLTFSADSKTLLLLGGDGASKAKLKVWDVATGKEIGDWQGKGNYFGTENDLLGALSPDGKTIATVTSDKPYWPAPSLVKLWDTATGRLRARFIGHRHQVYGIIFSPDGKSLATLDVNPGVGQSSPQPPTPNVNVKVWDVSDSPLSAVGPGAGSEGPPIGLPVDTSAVTTLAPSPDGKTVAVGFANGAIRICEARTLKVQRELRNQSLPVDYLNYSPDGKRLTASYQGNGRDDGRVFSPDGKQLVAPSVGSDSVPKTDIWEMAGGQVVDTFPGSLRLTRAFDGTSLATSVARSWGGWSSPTLPTDVTVWDVATKQPRLEIKAAVLFAQTRDGAIAASGWDSGRNGVGAPFQIKLWDVATRKERLLPHRVIPTRAGSISLFFSPDGKYLAIWSPGLQVLPEGAKETAMKLAVGLHLSDVATGKQHALLPGVAFHDFIHDGAPLGLFSPDSKVLLTFDRDADAPRSKLTLWDVATAKERAILSNPDKFTTVYAAFSPDGKSLATLTIGEWVREMYRDGKLVTDVSDTRIKPASPSGGGSGGVPLSSMHPVYEIHVWDVATQQKRSRFIVAWNGSVDEMAFGADGRTIYTLTNLTHRSSGRPNVGQRLRAWDAATGKECGSVGDHSTGFKALAYAPDGRLLAATDQPLHTREPPLYDARFKVRLWDMSTEKQPKELADPQIFTEAQLPLRIDPNVPAVISNTPPGPNETTVDGKVKAATTDKGIELVETATGNVLHVLKGNEGVTRLAFTPDGKTLAVGTRAGAIRLWNVAAGRLVLAIPAHAGPVTGLAFRADGRLLASCGDAEIRYWRAATDDEVAGRLP